ncbi:unnamed protein product [Diatraea saccharalis]|uniref:Rho GTPase-activating protein 15 n=1 Tax=Diatraea saccharalis TaxID=40085 RepID=A0A9N9R7K9_9NEOP|nr:unnamed protein product [Diatraea saccharalis]
MTIADAMDKDKPRPAVKRPDVLRKLNAESLLILERGLGEIPQKLRPKKPPIPVRGNSTQLVVREPSFLSSCLPTIPQSPTVDTPPSATSSEDERISPIKKSFSFRDRLSRMSIFGKDKDKMDKPKCKTIIEDEKHEVKSPGSTTRAFKPDHHDHKNSKRFWFFRNKEITEKKRQIPVYVRSKSFEFLPRAAEETETEKKPDKSKRTLKHSLSYVFSSTDSLDTLSNESSEFPSNVYYDNDDNVFLKSVKEFASESSTNNSSMSIVTSTSSGIAVNMFKTQSVQDIMDEFHKAVEMFSESYLSDSEPYTRTGQKKEKVAVRRKSSSFSNIPSPKIMQVNKVDDISEDFKKQLSKALIAKRESGGLHMKPSPCRRGSVTDWFVLEDKAAATAAAHEDNKYRRAQKKPVNRVRRISSTKYWITPEESAVYCREQRPPLVIPRITQYRAPRREAKAYQHSYQEDQEPASVKSSVRQYEQLQDWSPTSERSRGDLERSFSKANSDSPPFVRINKRLGNSTENLLFPPRRPNHLQLPASSSGDSLDNVEVREHEPGYIKSRKSRSMVAPKHRLRSPVPAPRLLLNQPSETFVFQAPVIMEGPVKRTKFSESGKKSKKNWNDCYMVLTPTALVFFKDQKTYLATRVGKQAGTPPSPTAPRADLVLPLRNAHLVHCIQMHTRRFTKSMVLTVGYDQYLLQDETEEGAKRWLINIQNIIYKLGPPMPEEYLPQYLSSNTDLESLGRTPPATRHTPRQRAGGSSNEDLSDSTEASIQKSHVRSILRKFFPKRPAMEVLVKKGIYKDEPVFGRKLEEVCPANSPRVPEFVVACVREIESNEDNMCTDGLYRASGNLSQVQKIRLEIDQNNLSVIESNTDIHVLTGSLKLFFRELKEPLIPCNIFDRILAACSIKPREAKIKEFRDIVQALPQCNRDTLKFLLEHLLRVTQYSERNRMHTANLAIVFGPTLLWAPAEQAHNIAIDCIQQNNVVDILLNDFKDIFIEDNPKGKKKA